MSVRWFKIKAYELSDLTGKARERALDTVREDINNDPYLINDTIKEVFSNELSEVGLPTSDICWSLRSCQGDGTSFYGYVDDVATFIEKAGLREQLAECFVEGEWCFIYSINISSNSAMYCHENTMTVNIEWESPWEEYDWQLALLESKLEDFEKIITSFIVNKAKELNIEVLTESEFRGKYL